MRPATAWGLWCRSPHPFFTKVAAQQGIQLGEERDYGVGMFFFPQDNLLRSQARKMLEIIAAKEGVEFLGWRRVPVVPEVLGQMARDSMPAIYQCFLRRPGDVERGLDFDRKLYVVRREFEQSNDHTYVASLSSRTIVYKGMFLVDQLRKFYPDLQDEDYVSAIAMVHSRFSTNTTPSWERAHPNRLILHNGEINTIRGNVDRMLAREETMFSSIMADDIDKVLPVVDQSGSDSSMLDNNPGISDDERHRGLPLAVMLTIPEAWRGEPELSREVADMYHYSRPP